METQERIVPITIEDEMKDSYLDYAMSVIVSRALPDVCDGLKPVHRRILYSMSRQNLTPGRPYKKSASTVGDVIAKYHPHGDKAIYDSMVRMAQDFNLRYLLVDGHGNFGSIDGDPPAAMRYTESRLTRMAIEMLEDLDKETIDFRPNFDNSLEEPVVLPAKLPNLLVNGSVGIAVGMATNIPPHNLGEVVDGLVTLIDDPEVPDEQLFKIIRAPDFPTGGLIMGLEGVRNAFSTGRGSITMRAVTEIFEHKNGRYDIIVTEIPYQVNKAKLVEQIANLVKEKKVSGIRDIRDESDRRGMRVVIELSSNNNLPQITLNQLFKRSSLQSNFSVNMVALVNGVPKLLTLRDTLKLYLEHRYRVIVRRSQFELKKAKARAHILEGLQIALDNIDEIIATIRASQTGAEAKEKLIERFHLSDVQAQAILDMRLQRLTGLERLKIDEEYAELLKKISYLEDLLASDTRIHELIREELLEIKNKYSDARRSKITRGIDTNFDQEDLIPESDVFVTISHGGYIKRFPLMTYKRQRRGGKGIGSSKLKDEDFIEHTFVTTTHHYLLFFTNKAKVYRLKVYEIPEMGRKARGTYLMNLIQIDRDEYISAIIPVRDFSKDSGYLVMATKKGYIKKTALSEYAHIYKVGLFALTLSEDDELVAVHQTSGNIELFLSTRKGKAIRFREDQIRPIGRRARGVKGMKLRQGDYVVAMDYICKGDQVLVITENGLGKRTPLEEFSVQKRYGYGLIATKVTKKTGPVVMARIVHEDDELIVTTNWGYVIRLKAKDLSIYGRATQGVIVIRLDPDDIVTGFSVIPYEYENQEELEDEE
ncbi:MAG: DNA gyrase subunit A [Candidatus Eremiobacteraeota bacterium]|nr:DNA gyrase subunit A [Candidatus Eremiobacteraeota bacterium]